MAYLRSALLTAACLTIIACASSGSQPRRAKQLSFEPTFPYDAERQPALDGVWSNAKHGVLVAFDGPKFDIYNRITQYCWPERVTALREGYLRSMAESSLMSDKSKLVFRQDRDATPWEFQPIAALPKGCDDPKSRLTVFDIFVDTMRQNYPHFERRGVRWTRTTANIRRELTSIDSDEALLALITRATVDIGDPNLRLRGPGFRWVGEGSASRQRDLLRVAFERQEVISDFDEYRGRWYQAIQAQIPPRLLQRDPQTRLDGNLVYGRMAGNVGYLYIADTTQADTATWMTEIETALKSLSTVSALIIDVSMVSGGNPAVLTGVASMLVPRKAALYSAKVHRIADEQWGIATSTHGQLVKNTPIYVVTTHHTSGAGELLPLVLRGLPGVRLIGETTRGALSQPLQVSLPNGWILDIPMVLTADRAQNLYDGVGISPDFALELFSESQLTDAHWQAITTLAALIQEGHFNRPGA